MLWVDFETVLTSFYNAEPLNNRQIDFIKRTSNEISHNININDWINIELDGRNYPMIKYLIDEFHSLNAITINQILNNQVNNTFLLNKNLLQYFDLLSFDYIFEGMEDCGMLNKNNSLNLNHYGEYLKILTKYVKMNNYNKYEYMLSRYNGNANTYINFLKRTKECYEKQYIGSNNYISLLNWLLYVNVNQVMRETYPSDLEIYYEIVNAPNLPFHEYKNDYKNMPFPIFLLHTNDALSSDNEWNLRDLVFQGLTFDIIFKIIDNLASVYIDNAKLKPQMKPIDVLNEIKFEILKYIRFSISNYCVTFIKNRTLNEDNEYINKYKIKWNNILSLDKIKDKIDRDFKVTETISASKKYKAYEKNYNQFINYYHGLYMKSKNDENYDEKSKETIQRPSLEDIKNKIQNKLGIETNIESNNKNGTPLPGSIFETILPFLVHTKFDRKSNINNQTQNNHVQSNINEINTNNDRKDNSDDDESDDVA